MGVTDHSPPELELVELLDELLDELDEELEDELLDDELDDELLEELLEPLEELDEPPPQAKRVAATTPRVKALAMDTAVNRKAVGVCRHEWSIIKPHYYKYADVHLCADANSRRVVLHAQIEAQKDVYTIGCQRGRS